MYITTELIIERLSPFIRRNYQDATKYSELIIQCVNNPVNPDEIYCELHHVFPKSLFPELAEIVEFQVLVSYVIHLEFHRLLASFTDDSGMHYAYNLMCSYPL